MLKNKKLLSLVAALLSATCLLSACGGGPAKQENASPVTYAEGDSIYPMQCEDELTLWTGMNTEDLNKTPLGLAWQEQTGAKIHFEQPVSNGAEAMNTLLASGQLPDIMVTDFTAMPGGVQKMVDDGVIIELDQYIDAYAPNFKKYLEENPEVAKQIRSDDGHYYYFPFVRGDERLTASQGLALRKDLLDKAGLDVPVTVDDWTEVLRAFKEQGASAPFSSSNFWLSEIKYGFIGGAYGVTGDYYIDNGTVKYGFMEDKMIDVLKLYNSWYEEGLLDRNIVSVADIDGQIFQGETAASILWAGSGIGKYMNAKPSPEFDFVAAAPAVLEEGQVSQFGGKGFLYGGTNNAYITTACKNIELAMRFIDYNYSEAGHILMNFGIEGESFNWVDGYPAYTDEILKNPEGKSISEAMKPYLQASSSFPGIQDYRYLEQYYQLQNQKDAVGVWSVADTSATRMPNIIFTAEESDKLSTIATNIQTCAEEWAFKFITGTMPIEKFDDFRAELKTFGIEEAIKIYQAAYDRFEAR